MSRPLDELIVRHLDDALTAAEADALADRLRADPAARERFRLFCVQAAAIGEAAAANRRAEPVRKPIGRRVAVIAGAVVAFGVAAVLLWPTATTTDDRATLAGVTGQVRVRVAGADHPVGPGDRLAPGAVVSTSGFGSAAVIAYPDGTAVTLTGDAEATVDRADRPRLTVARGVASADVPVEAFVLATPEARAVAGGGAKLSVCRSADQTEVGVSAGRVQVTDAAGDPLMDMGGGEVGTVDAHGAASKQPAGCPDAYSWHLDRPRPVGWQLGRVEPLPGARPFARAAVPELWDDPYIRRTCWQIRSEARWTNGLFLIHPDTRFRVRYKVDRPGVGQLLVVVRRDPPSPKDCHVLLAPIEFAPAVGGGWRTAELGVPDWQLERKPERGPFDYPYPWVTFQVVFNTYERDLGLKVAEFTAARGLPVAD